MKKVVDGRQLRAGRAILGLTIREMANLAGLHRNSVSRVESLNNLPVSAYAADKISRALTSQGIIFSTHERSLSIGFCGLTVRMGTKYRKDCDKDTNK